MLYSEKEAIFAQFSFVPTAAQQKVHESDARFRVCAAGARFGKSMLAGAEAAAMLIEPNRNIWICGTQYELAEKEFNWAIEFLNKMKFRDVPILNFCRVTNQQRGQRSIIAPWNSYIRTKSTEKPQTLLGEELDLLVLSEASQISRIVWERMLRARLGPRKGKLLAISTPNADNGLFYDFFKKAESKEDREWQSWLFSTLENIYFDKEEYERARNELAKKVFEEQYEGKFVSRRGKIFESIATIEALPRELDHWPVLIGVQKGFKNPLAIVFCAIDPITKHIYAFDEFHELETTIEKAVGVIREKTKGKRLLGCVVDYWDYDCLNEMKKFGMLTTTNDNEKKIGRQMAQVRRIQTLQSFLEKQKLFVYSKLEKTIKDINESKWPESKDEGEALPEMEIPKNIHLQAPYALSHVCCFMSESGGFDPYRVR